MAPGGPGRNSYLPFRPLPAPFPPAFLKSVQANSEFCREMRRRLPFLWHRIVVPCEIIWAGGRAELESCAFDFLGDSELERAMYSVCCSWLRCTPKYKTGHDYSYAYKNRKFRDFRHGLCTLVGSRTTGPFRRAIADPNPVAIAYNIFPSTDSSRIERFCARFTVASLWLRWLRRVHSLCGEDSGS
eukprot:2671482-Rhodomonas_salina.4